MAYRSLIYLLLLLSQFALAQPRIVTSVRPLQFIAEAISLPGSSVVSLIDGSDSPHHFSLTPSDRMAVATAALHIWIGPQFEAQLADLFAEGSSITASELAGIRLHRQDEQIIDPHLWLDPFNGGILATAVAEQLVALDPEHAASYRENLRQFIARLDTALETTRARLDEIQPPAYGVYHNAYQYFEKRVDLAPDLVLLNNPEVLPGVRRMAELQNAIALLDLRCLFVESDSDRALLQTLIGDRAVELATVDVLGYEIASSRTAYLELLSAVGDTYADCFESKMH